MKQKDKQLLPIDSHLEKIAESVRNYSTILLKASPGSGKTTRLPWHICHSLNKKVVVLEPRRLAAKLAAQRIAEEQSLLLGQEVGYHFRFEKKLSRETRLIFYTEGTFLKKFLHDPLLEGIDIVILDEFHERHLETDLALALLRNLQLKRPLKIILMSATLDTKMVSQFQEVCTFEIDAKNYPVEIHYLPNQPSVLNRSLELKVRDAVVASSGHTLVFLPGMREMLRVQEVLEGYNVYLLHAELSRELQQKALGPSSERKIILATNIAESSITIQGIEVVIDSGIQRQSYYSPWSGLKYLKDSPVTKSSAIQRAGRAGRTQPGVCYRLYSLQDFNEREEYTIPEILNADLTDSCLLVTGAGQTPQWYEPPPTEKWSKAKELLNKMGALKDDKLTLIGEKIFDYPVDSRIARALIAGEKLVMTSKIALLNYLCDEIESDKTGSLKKKLSFFLTPVGDEQFPWEKCLLTGFFDQVSKYRAKQRDFIHYSGKVLKAPNSFEGIDGSFYIIFSIGQRQEAVKLIQVDETWLWEIDPFPFVEEDEIVLEEKFSIKRKLKFGSILVEESLIKPLWSELSTSLKEKILSLTKNSIKAVLEGWKNTSDYKRLHYWFTLNKIDLESFIHQVSLEDYFEKNDELNLNGLIDYIKGSIQEKFDLSRFDIELPSTLFLGGKKSLTIHYSDEFEPSLEAPIQEFYGLNETPTIMSGKIPLTLKLLGPHKRPIQITKDLKNFWQKTYQEMKKEYQREYPKHYWPDKPWEAKPYLLKSHLPKP